MKMMLTAALAALATAAAAPGWAQTRPGGEWGLEMLDYRYSEPLDGPDVKDRGLMIGVHGRWTYTRAAWSVETRGRLAAGRIDYNYGGERIDDVIQARGDVQFAFGRDFRLGNGATVAPYVGYGVRALADGSGGEVSSQGSLGYDRNIVYQYLPLGVRFYSPTGGVEMRAQYNRLLDGESESMFSDISPDAPDVVLDMDRGFGFELAASWTTPVAGRQMRIGPFVRLWSIEDSDVEIITDGVDAVEIIEPRNRTWEVGLHLSHAF